MGNKKEYFMKKIIIVVATMTFGLSAYANSMPKWCSSDRLSKTEHIICSDRFLREADILLSKTYKKLMSYRGKEGHEGMWYREVKDNQKDWLKERNRLSDRSKIMDSYMDNIKLLYGELDGHRKLDF